MPLKNIDQINSRIKELRELLEELQDAAEAVREQKQHEEIEHLEQHLAETDFDIHSLDMFKDELMKEMKSLLVQIKSLLGKDSPNS